jgi:uncharacterized protein YcaQ
LPPAQIANHNLTVRQLRRHAISQSLFPPTSLKAALLRLGFVQADPIRAPARAQDLILRHRVEDYRAGDLERRYASLDLEEDVLYAYGFLPRAVWQLLHPRNPARLSQLEKKVLSTVQESGRMHPAELEAHFGRKRVVNAWGGYSKATTRALEKLHRRGLLRIAGRENGIRIYEANSPVEPSPPARRLMQLVRVVAKLLAPVSERSLQGALMPLRRSFAGGSTRDAVRELIRMGELTQKSIDGVNYVWPTRDFADEEPSGGVRFLAPFDPLIWDRRRFEHFWGWPYRFEAYTPVVKRTRGYYALPLLWGENIIGWANAGVAGGCLNVEVGFVGKQPRDAKFRAELDSETGRLEAFLGLSVGESGGVC